MEIHSSDNEWQITQMAIAQTPDPPKKSAS